MLLPEERVGQGARMGVVGSKADLWGEDSGGPTCPPLPGQAPVEE